MLDYDPCNRIPGAQRPTNSEDPDPFRCTKSLPFTPTTCGASSPVRKGTSPRFLHPTIRIGLPAMNAAMFSTASW